MADSPRLPLDYQADRDALAQRQALQQALMQRAMTPQGGQMVGPNFANPGMAASIGAPIIQALLAAKMGRDNRNAAGELAEKYKNQMNRLTPKDILSIPGASLDSRRKAAMDPSGDLAGLAPDQREHIVNGQVVTTTPGQPAAAVGDFRDKLGPVQTVARNPDGTPIQAQVTEGTGENKYTPSGGVRVNIDTAQKAGDKFGTELAGKRAEILSKSYDNAMAAKKALAAMDEAKRDLGNGIKSGITSHIDLALAKTAQALGMKADPTVVNTESFRSNMARETLNLVKNLGAGTGISNADRDFAEKAAGGDIMMDNQSMLRLANIAAAASGNVLAEHQRLVESNADATGALPQDLATFHVPWSINAGKEIPGNVTYNPATKHFETIPSGSGGVGVPPGKGKKPSVSNW